MLLNIRQRERGVAWRGDCSALLCSARWLVAQHFPGVASKSFCSSRTRPFHGKREGHHIQRLIFRERKLFCSGNRSSRSLMAPPCSSTSTAHYHQLLLSFSLYQSQFSAAICFVAFIDSVNALLPVLTPLIARVLLYYIG